MGPEKRSLTEQINAALVTLTSNDWVTTIEGLAGAAKTTTVGAIREFLEDQGYTATGFGMTSRAAKELREVGITAQTVASVLANPLPQPTRPRILVCRRIRPVGHARCQRIP